MGGVQPHQHGGANLHEPQELHVARGQRPANGRLGERRGQQFRGWPDWAEAPKGPQEPLAAVREETVRYLVMRTTNLARVIRVYGMQPYSRWMAHSCGALRSTVLPPDSLGRGISSVVFSLAVVPSQFYVRERRQCNEQ